MKLLQEHGRSYHRALGVHAPPISVSCPQIPFWGRATVPLPRLHPPWRSGGSRLPRLARGLWPLHRPLNQKSWIHLWVHPPSENPGYAYARRLHNAQSGRYSRWQSKLAQWLMKLKRHRNVFSFRWQWMADAKSDTSSSFRDWGAITNEARWCSVCIYHQIRWQSVTLSGLPLTILFSTKSIRQYVPVRPLPLLQQT